MSILYDLLLYATLGGGILLSHARRAPRALDITSRGTVLLLVASLGVLLQAAGNVLQVDVLAPGVLLAMGSVGSSVLLVRVFGARPARSFRPSGTVSRAGKIARDLVFPVIIVAALVLGWGLAIEDPSASTSAGTWLDAFLLLLVFQIGWSLTWEWEDLRHVTRPLAAALASAVLVGSVYALVGGVPWRTAFAIVGAFGWYSLAGPLVAQAAGPTLGLVAFLANFLRENLTMTTSPALARAAGADGIVSAGGATSMDTTLLFAVEYGGKTAGGRALAVGTILTLLAPLLLGLLLGTF